MTTSRSSILLLLSLSILVGSSFTLAGNVIVRNGQLNVSGGIYGDSDTFYIDSENDRVGIGTTSPSGKLDITNGVVRALAGTNVLPSSGTGVEIIYPSDIDSGYVIAYNRTGGAYKTLRIDGSNLLLNTGSNGYVGIGTTAPGQKLVVDGTDAELWLSDNDTKAGLFADDSGNRANVFFNHDGSRKWDIGVNTDQGTSDTLFFRDNGSDYDMVIDASGNVGIGTTGPDAPLSFGSSIGNKINLYDGSNWNIGIGAYSTINTMEFGVHSSADDFTFGYGVAGSLTRLLTIKGTGNVGIDTTSPVNTLDIGSDNWNSLSLANEGSFMGFNVYYDGGWKYKSHGYAGFLRQGTDGLEIWTAGNNTGGAGASMSPGEYVVISPTGKVGIGTTAPGQRLSIDNGELEVVGTNSWTSDGDEATLFLGDAGPNGVTMVRGLGTPGGMYLSVYHPTASGILGSNSIDALFVEANTGNVGIGTTEPGARLDIVGAGNGIPFSLKENTNGNYPAVQTLGGAISFNHMAGDRDFGFWNTDTTDDSSSRGFRFYQQTGASSKDTLMVIQDSGNVGIGTTSPESPLDISKSLTGTVTRQDGLKVANVLTGTNSFDSIGRGFQGIYVGPTVDNATNFNGIYVIPQLANGEVTIGNIRGILAYTGYGYNSGATVTTAVGLLVRSWGNVAPGTFTNQYGIYIENITRASNNYALYSAGGQSYFAGNVGIGTTGPESKLQVTGGGLCVGSDANCNSDNNNEGVVYSSSTSMTQYDVAEEYPTRENLSEGDVLVLDPDNPVFVKRSVDPYDSLVLGVVSAKPGVLLGGFNGDQYRDEMQVAVALSGRVPVKVSGENGPIQVGDALVSSSVSGHAMKASETGKTLGIALEPFSGPGNGTIMCFVNVGMWISPEEFGQLKADNEALKQAVCGIDPNAEICAGM